LTFSKPSLALVLNLPMYLRTGRFYLCYRTKIQAQKRFDFMEQTVEEAKKIGSCKESQMTQKI
jgi:hypothetical protein